MEVSKKRTTIESVLMVLVVLSIVRQFMLGSYHNMFLGNLH